MIAVARLLTVIGSAVSLFLLALFTLAVLRSQRDGEASRIQARYGGSVVRVRNIDASMPAADVDAFDDLLRIADRGERMILHEERDGTHTYVVEDGELLLRYRVNGEEPMPTPVESEKPPVEPEEAPVEPEEAPVEPEEAPVESEIAAPLSQPNGATKSEAEIVETHASEDEAGETAVSPATPSVSWSDGWALGPARKR